MQRCFFLTALLYVIQCFMTVVFWMIRIMFDAKQFVEEVVSYLAGRLPWIERRGLKMLTEITMLEKAKANEPIPSSTELAELIIKEVEDAQRQLTDEQLDDILDDIEGSIHGPSKATRVVKVDPSAMIAALLGAGLFIECVRDEYLL